VAKRPTSSRATAGNGELRKQPKEEQKKKKPIKCFGCGQFNHFKRDCPRTRCYECQGTGHIGRNCPEKRSRGSNPNNPRRGGNQFNNGGNRYNNGGNRFNNGGSRFNDE